MAETGHVEGETLVMYGDAVKAISDDGKVGGYLCRFGSPSDTDIERDYYTKDTDFGTANESTVYYHHGFDAKLGMRVLGKAAHVKTDEVGLWVEAQLELRDEYEKAIFDLVKNGKLGWSSGTASHLVERVKRGNAYEITRWPLGLDASLTPTPAEYRNQAVPVKSLKASTLLDEVLNEAKAESLSRRIGMVYDSFRRHFDPRYERDAYVSEVFDDAVVAYIDTAYYRIPYKIDDDFEVTFSGREDWIEVVQKTEWAEKKAAYLKHIKNKGLGEVTVHVDASELKETLKAFEQRMAGAISGAADKGQNGNTKSVTTMEPEDVQKEQEAPAPAAPMLTAEQYAEIAKQGAQAVLAALGVESVTNQKSATVEEIKAGGGRTVKGSVDTQAPNLIVNPTKDDKKGVKAYERYLRTGDIGAAREYQQEVKANAVDMQEGTDAEGGYLVHPDHAREIVALRDENSIVRAAGARRFTTSSNVIDIPIEETSLSNFAITAEEATYDKDTPGLGNKQVTVYKFTKLMKISEELLEDHDSNLLEFITDAVGRAMALTENHYFLVGTGTGQPEGIFNKTADDAFASATAITAGEVQQVYYSLNSPYRSNGVWIMNGDTERLIRSLQGEDFLFRSTPAGNVSSGVGNGADTLMNRPVYNSESVAQAAADAKTIAFGDMRYFAVVEKRGLTVRRLNELYAANGQIGFLFSFRVGSAILQSEAIRVYAQAAA